MPSLNRLLVLAVLGVSLCVQAAPVPEGTNVDVRIVIYGPSVQCVLTDIV